MIQTVFYSFGSFLLFLLTLWIFMTWWKTWWIFRNIQRLLISDAEKKGQTLSGKNYHQPPNWFFFVKWIAPTSITVVITLWIQYKVSQVHTELIIICIRRHFIPCRSLWIKSYKNNIALSLLIILIKLYMNTFCLKSLVQIPAWEGQDVIGLGNKKRVDVKGSFYSEYLCVPLILKKMNQISFKKLELVQKIFLGHLPTQHSLKNHHNSKGSGKYFGCYVLGRINTFWKKLPLVWVVFTLIWQYLCWSIFKQSTPVHLVSYCRPNEVKSFLS